MLVTLAIAPPLLAGATAARAQTTSVTGGGVTTGDGILFEMLGHAPIFQPTGTPPAVIDMTNTAFSFIKNPYIAVVQGIAGTYSVGPFFTNGPTYSHNIPGMLSFGNIAGSVRYGTDSRQAMNGANFEEFYLSDGTPYGYGVWPLASRWETTGNFISYDYSAYLRAQVDTTDVPVVGDTGAPIQNEPLFVNNALSSIFNGPTNVQINQEIKLYRSTARFRWTITNNDTTAHTVRLRFNVFARGALSNTTGIAHTGFFFEDPSRGLSDDVRALTGADVPDQITIYGKRFESDSVTDPPFAVRQTFRGFGATLPQKLVLGHPFDLRPAAGAFDQPPFTRIKLDQGVTLASYYGPFGLGPGQSAEVITYYGNGFPTERPDEDFVTAADATEALAYNSAAATADGIAGNSSADPSVVIPQFLSPNPIQIYAGVYNRIVNNPQTSVTLNGVRASLTLPTGLALTTPPGSSTVDPAEKKMGDNASGSIIADRGSDVNWYVKPTGEAYGTLAYQVNITTNELGTRQVTRTITIPATPFKSVTAAAFQMLGFPFQFDPLLSNNGDPSTVVNGLTTPKDEPVTFYQWVPDPQSLSGAGHYQVATRLDNGVGYMYRPNLDRTIFAKGVQPFPQQAPLGGTVFNDTTQRQVELSRGWNMISDPYVYEIPVRYLRFLPKEGGSAASQTFLQAVNSGLIRAGIFFLNYDSTTKTASYDFFQDAGNPLRPWQAYWMYSNSPVTLVYNLPTQHNSAILPDANGNEPATRARGVIASGRAVTPNPTVNDWRLQIVATQDGKKTDKATIIGISNGGSVSAATRSLPKPPAPFADYVYAGIVKSDMVTRFAQDVRSGPGEQTWEIEVTSDKAGPVTVTWPNVSRLPKLINLSLKDSVTGRKYAMRSTSSITVNVGKDQPSRFVVTAKQEASTPLTISPLRTITTRGQGYSFAFDLSRDASISGNIQTLTGKVIATFAAGRAATRGQNRISWSGRAQNGSPLAPGPYMVEITARDEDGQPVTRKDNFISIE